MKRFGLCAAVALLMIVSGCSREATADKPSTQDEYETQAVVDSVTEQAKGEEASEEPDSAKEDVSLQTEPEQAFSNLEVEISEGTLYIRSGASFSLADRNGEEADYEISGGTLYYKKSDTREVVLVLPEGESYEMCDLLVKNGHAYVEEMPTVHSLNLEVSHGEVSLDGVSVLNDSYIKVEEGSASVYGEPGGVLTAVCYQGHLNLAVPFEESDCNYSIEVSEGDIRLDGTNYHGKSYSNTVDNNGEYSMELSCTRGDLSVEFGK